METEIFHKEKLGSITYNPTDNILLVTFHHKEISEDIEDELKAFMKKYLEAFLHYKVSKVLFDYRDLYFAVTEELSKWLLENIVKVTVANGLKKLAQIYPEDIITKFGLELLVEKTITDAPGPKRMLFDNFEQAYQWLKKD